MLRAYILRAYTVVCARRSPMPAADDVARQQAVSTADPSWQVATSAPAGRRASRTLGGVAKGPHAGAASHLRAGSAKATAPDRSVLDAALPGVPARSMPRRMAAKRAHKGSASAPRPRPGGPCFPRRMRRRSGWRLRPLMCERARVMRSPPRRGGRGDLPQCARASSRTPDGVQSARPIYLRAAANSTRPACGSRRVSLACKGPPCRDKGPSRDGGRVTGRGLCIATKGPKRRRAALEPIIFTADGSRARQGEFHIGWR
jgi:hypothetical protein